MNVTELAIKDREVILMLYAKQNKCQLLSYSDVGYINVAIFFVLILGGGCKFCLDQDWVHLMLFIGVCSRWVNTELKLNVF